MTIPTRARIRSIAKGDVITANPFLNSIVNQLNRGLEDFVPPTQVEPTLQAGQESEQPFMICTVVEEKLNDLLVFTPGLALVYVTKPPALQGWIATRTVSDEDQIIIRPYATGLRIFAFRDIDGGTVVSGSQGRANEWQDLNVDARAWAESA